MATRTFTVAATVQDPLSADRLVEVLRQAGLDAFSRPGGAASSTAFGSMTPGFWDVLAPSEKLDEAVQKLITDELAAIESEGDENARAAEEEEAASDENQVPR